MLLLPASQPASQADCLLPVNVIATAVIFVVVVDSPGWLAFCLIQACLPACLPVLICRCCSLPLLLLLVTVGLNDCRRVCLAAQLPSVFRCLNYCCFVVVCVCV